jgi:hypothetical protein
MRLIHYGPAVFISTLLLSLSRGMAAEFKDIYLIENRVCKACRWEALDDQHVRLTNRNGDRVVVKQKEILGIDRHPVWRKLIYNSLHGIGLPGPVIVPNAFEDGWEYACKYCEVP